MRSISFKLVGTFILVTLIGTLVNALIITGVTNVFFNRYLDFTGKNLADIIIPQLVSYYQQKGTWEGVNELFQSRPMPMMDYNRPAQGGPPPIMMPNNGGANGNGLNGGGGQNGGGGNGGGANNNQPPKPDLRFILYDQSGKIVADNSQGADVQPAPPDQAENTYPIVVNNQTVGTLRVFGKPTDPNSPGFAFIGQVTNATWITTLVTAILGVLLGFLIFRQIISPLQSMTKAARQIATGDLTQRVQVTSKDEIGTLASTFNQMVTTLENNQQQRRNMTADIAHELRTPISIIQANLEAMLDGVLPASPDEIASLRDESALLARLVDDLRLLSLAEAGQLKLQKSQVDLKQLLERAAEPYFTQAEDQQIHFSIETEGALPSVEVDTDRLSMVVRNLLNNALRYTPPGGSVLLKASHPAASPSQICIEVRDSGSGIAAKDLPYVFDRFYRADSSRSRSSGGSGIGLAIVKQLVEAHGGQIQVESPIMTENGASHGTRFWFTIDINGAKAVSI